MGHASAEGFAEAVTEGTATLRQALAAHIRGNFFPALPIGYIDVAEQVLDALAEAGVTWEGDDDPTVWQRTIDLPRLNPMPRRATIHDDGTGTATVGALFEALRLEAFLD